MYYKKRPELMKLVEEFYRAYRALAERYDHATGELRHAHRMWCDGELVVERLMNVEELPLWKWTPQRGTRSAHPRPNLRSVLLLFVFLYKVDLEFLVLDFVGLLCMCVVL